MVGYDDREIAQFMRPALTTVVLPHHEMGLQAAETLIDGDAGPRAVSRRSRSNARSSTASSVGLPRPRA